MGDYGAAPGSPKAALGNRIYRNKFFVKAKEHAGPKEYLPMVFAIYYSASGGQNYVYENEIRVEKLNPSSKTITAAFYICGGPKYFGGEFYNNTVTSNVPAVWIASMYGGASQSRLANNTFKFIGKKKKFATVNMGYQDCKTCYAKDVEFRSNTVEGNDFSIHETSQPHSYKIYWTYRLQLLGKNRKLVANQKVVVKNKDNELVSSLQTDKNGWVETELLSREKQSGSAAVSLSYTIEVAGRQKEISLTKNTTDKMTIITHE